MKFLILILLCSTSFATKYVAMSAEEKVQSSDLIVVAKVQQLRCLSKTGATIPAFDNCTGPGIQNKLTYTLEVQEVLFQLKSKHPRIKTKEVLEFGYTAKSHWNVPKDVYSSELGKEHVFYLNINDNGRIRPMHEAFFIDDLKNKKSVMKLIRKKK